MALVYKRSSVKAARRYDRSSGMEPNPGVEALSVINGRRRGPGKSGRGSPRRNPFQWIAGRGKRHVHESPSYKGLRGALAWKGRGGPHGAHSRLYSVDEFGTILGRPIRKHLLSNRRKNSMAYDIGALRKAMRRNQWTQSAGGSRGGGNVATETIHARGVAIKRTRGSAGWGGTGWGSGKRTKKSRTSKYQARGTRRAVSRSASAKKAAATRRKKKLARSRAAKKAARTRKSSKRSSKKTSKKAGRRKTKRGVKAKARRRTKRAVARKARRRTRRRVSRRAPGYVKRAVSRRRMPIAMRIPRMSLARSGAASVFAYTGRVKHKKRRISARRAGKALAHHRTSKRLAANAWGRPASRGGGRRRHARSSAPRASKRVHRNSRRRGSRRGVRRNSRRRGSRRRVSRNQMARYIVMKNKRRGSRRNSRRGSRRNSRRGYKMRRNMLAAAKVRAGKRWGRARTYKPVGRKFQLVEFGSRSKSRSGRRMTGYPVAIPAHVSARGYVRRFRFGGAAKDAHKRAVTSGYREHKKYPRRRVTRNRRTSMKRNRYMVAKNRHRHSRRNHRRGFRRNAMLMGADLMKDVAIPVAGGTAGFITARLLSNGLANVPAITGLLDKGGGSDNTKIVANLVGIVATLGLGTKVPMIKQHQGAIVTGMGLALVDRLIAKFGGASAGYLGEYVDQPLGYFGEYVDQPLGAYVNDPAMNPMNPPMGEYVDQPLGGLGTLYAAAGYQEGIDPANQASVEGLMDVMEAAAGTGAVQAAAGMGTLYAAAGLGEEADATLQAMYAKNQPGFVSTLTPVDAALQVTKNMPYDRKVPDSLVTPEGKGYAGGLFARQLFSGMLSG